MGAQDEEITVEQAAEHFAAEVAWWREVRGMSKRALALAMGFDPSYVSHMESGRTKPTEEFARLADEAMNAGKAIWRRWCDYEQAKAKETRVRRPPVAPPVPRRPEQPYATGSALVVEHDAARLQYDGRSYRLIMRRLLRNTGDQPVTRYLIRISVDRYPGDPERSNAHYRAHPLTWDELDLTATCRGEPMRWQAKHDRDAFKEVWLLFDNEHGRFPLYPGESVWIEYAYSVGDDKWGHWFQRAVRLPTERDEAERIVDELFAAMERISQVHPFAKGMGIAAPQTGIARAAAVVQPPGDAPAIILLNPRITTSSDETDEQYEGCLSFFDVRGLVPRPLQITVEATALTGETVTTVYERGLARLIHHEIDHLDGLLYTARMRTGVAPIPVEEYQQTGRAWAYE